MPFVSESQRRWMYSNHPKMARRWSRHTKKGKKLPAHVHNASPLRVDPTRTATLRREFSTALTSRLEALRRAIVKLIVEDDVFGLGAGKYDPFSGEFTDNALTTNTDYSSTQVNVKDPFVREQVKYLQSLLNPADVLELEDIPHITVRYGLNIDRPETVKNLLKHFGLVRVRLGRLSLVAGKDSDVLKVEVQSNELDEMNRRLALVPNTVLHRAYNPHLTIAYLNPGTGMKYLGPTRLTGTELLFDSMVFSDKNRSHSEIALNVFCPTGKGGGVDPSCSPGRVFETRLTSLDPDNNSPMLSLDAKTMDLWDAYIKGHGGKQKLIKAMRQNEDFQGDLQNQLEQMFPSGYAVLYRGGNVSEDEKFIGGSLSKKTAFDFASSFTGYEGVAEGRLQTYKIPIERIVGIGSPAEQELFFQKPKPKEPVTNTRWKFLTTSEKVEEFKAWLRNQIAISVIAGSITNENEYWKKYVMEGFRKGVGRVFDDFYSKTKTAEAGAKPLEGFFNTTKQQFLRQSFMQPVSVDKVKLLSGRVFTDLKGITEAMSTGVTRALTDGLVQGKSPRDVARMISKEVNGIGKKRALVLARTECLPGDTIVDGAKVKSVFRRWYEGPIIEIVTSNGRKFSATPNHPMLTKDGWISAGLIKNGHNLVCDRRKQDSVFSGNPDVDAGPTTLSQIFDSLNTVGIRERISCRNTDFHGDGMDGEVDVLSSNGELLIGNFATIAKPLVKSVFSPAGFSASRFCHSCGSLLSVNEQKCLCQRSECNSFRLQSSVNCTSVDSHVFADRSSRLSSSVSPNNLANVQTLELVGDLSSSPGIELSFGISATDPLLTKNYSNPPLVRTNFSGNLSLSKAGQIEFDDVLSVTVRPFSGHVYNLSTPYGYYTIERGLYTGNTIRAHAEGQLSAMNKLGVEGVYAAVEWSTSKLGVTNLGNPSPCKVCAPMANVVFSLEEAEGLIPRHANCMCSWIPASVLEKNGDRQTSDKGGIEAAIQASVQAEGGKSSSWIGADKKISTVRPSGLLSNSQTEVSVVLPSEWSAVWQPVDNVYCPTGEGGGVDPSCSSSVDQAIKAAEVLAAKTGVRPDWLDRPSVYKSKFHTGQGNVTLTAVNWRKIEPKSEPGRIKSIYEAWNSLKDKTSGFASWDSVAASSGLAVYEVAQEIKHYDLGDRGNRIGQTVDRMGAATYFKFKGSLVENVFCPTGQGGGVDSSCSPSPLTTDKVRKVLTGMISLERGAMNGALVGIKDLRKKLNMPKTDFDEMVLEMSRRGYVSLHRHDYVAPMTKEEVNQLVYSNKLDSGGAGEHPRGTYYVGIAVRQN